MRTTFLLPYAGLASKQGQATLARSSGSPRGARDRGSKGVRSDASDTCFPSTSKLQRLEQQPPRQTTTDLEAEVGRGYSCTSAAYLHPFVYKLECKLSSLPGNVARWALKKKKNQSDVPEAGRMRSTRYQGCCTKPSIDHALCGSGFQGSPGATGWRPGRRRRSSQESTPKLWPPSAREGRPGSQ